jgi:hypothetical protein
VADGGFGSARETEIAFKYEGQGGATEPQTFALAELDLDAAASPGLPKLALVRYDWECIPYSLNRDGSQPPACLSGDGSDVYAVAEKKVAHPGIGWVFGWRIKGKKLAAKGATSLDWWHARCRAIPAASGVGVAMDGGAS